MAEKASKPTKKPQPAKPSARNKFSKGDSVACEVCGLSVVVASVGGIPVSKETTLFCCGKPMKERKGPQKAKAAKSGKVAQTVSGWPMVQVAGSSGLVADPKEDVTQQ